MPSASEVLYYLVHPNQLRAILQWKIWHEPVHYRDPKKDTPTEASCFKYLDLTSRSFAAVIKELNPELLMPMSCFYLVLRGLDTIEDDMTLDIKKKEPLLRHFDQNMEKDGWTFNESGPNEADRELLVHFDDVIYELKKIKKEKPAYYDIIKDITVQMGNGMADYCLNAEHNENGVDKIADYELYCHYVAGLVGDGCTRLFVESKLANDQLLSRPELTESMGQFLQKTNIIRDVHEDWVDKRRFWPKEIWSKYVDNFEDLFSPKYREQAIFCQSEMVLNALTHADECLFYMAAIRDQSVFNFVAIPQSMAIATLELCFRNPAMFERNIKITKGDACKIMADSTQNLRIVCDVFKRYVRRIHQKNDIQDPNFTAISVQCGKIEQFIESIFPTQDIKQIHAQQKKQEEPTMDTWEAFVLLMAVMAVLCTLGGLMIGVAWLMGAKFDKLFQGLPPLPSGIPDDLKTAPSVGTTHEEL